MPAHLLSRARPRRTGLAATCLVALLLSVTTTPGLVAQDLDEVERQVDRLDQQLEATTARFEEVRGQVEATRAELDELRTKADELEAQAAEAQRQLADMAREAFKYGGSSILTTVLTADGVQGVIERAQFLDLVSGREQAQLEQAVSLRRQLDQTEQLIADRAAELEQLRAQLADEREQLADRLQAKQDQAADLRAIAARQRQITNGVQDGTYACIHDANSFIDSWGFPRSGGRSHEGVDVMAPHGVPVYAFTDGRISRLSQGGLGGISLYLWGDDGNEYFYTHLAGYAEGIHVGKRVEAGEKVAINGDTGNAAGTPHVHFELHPGGGAPINPYPYMRAAC